MRKLKFCLVLGGALAAWPVQAAPLKSVVELFTSQGCSSCPPADQLMGQLAHAPDSLVLSFPVDYWDYIGWKDTFASPAFTQRQKAYAVARGDGAVYTPQAVVDGLAHVVGSDGDAVRGAMAANAGALKLEIHLTESANKLHIAVDSGSGDGSVWLLKIASAREVAIARGENAHRSVTYTNIVRGMTRLGDWTGAAAGFDVALSDIRSGDADGYAVIVQAGSATRPRAILGAAKSNGL